MERRTLIRLLVGLAIGIPVLIEAVTFFGLVETQLLDGSDTRTATPADGVRRVGVDDELLPATPPSETVTEAVIRGGDTRWVFVFSVSVDNPTEAEYELRLRTLRLGSGRSIDGSASTGRIPAGGSGEVTGAWEIPPGSTPDSLSVVSVVYRPEGPTESTTTVVLAKVPVRAR